jgi:hypothetical protein
LQYARERLAALENPDVNEPPQHANIRAENPIEDGLRNEPAGLPIPAASRLVAGETSDLQQQADGCSASATPQLDLFSAPDALHEYVRKLQPDDISPRQAMEHMYNLTALVKS